MRASVYSSGIFINKQYWVLRPSNEKNVSRFDVLENMKICDDMYLLYCKLLGQLSAGKVQVPGSNICL